MRLLISLDDTDNLDSRGTGYRSRCLGELLQRTDLALVTGITRHQLKVDSRIPYTSHNSSACLTVQINPADYDRVVDYCRNFLQQESAPGSDAGLGVAPWAAVGTAIQTFGYQAKKQILNQATALNLARSADIILEGLTGDGGGVIGALAAIGLRVSGQDGRFIWLRSLRELGGVYTAHWLVQSSGIDKIMSIGNTSVPVEAKIEVGSWCRPILHQGQAVLLVEEVNGNENYTWRTAPKEMVKQY